MYLYVSLLLICLLTFILPGCEPYREPKQMLVNSLPIGVIIEKECNDDGKGYSLTIYNYGSITTVKPVNTYIYHQLVTGDTIYHNQ